MRWAAGIAAEHGARLHVVHASAVEAVDEARRWPGVTVETCPHYLAIDDDEADAIGRRARCNPPIRGAANQTRLWERLHAGAIDWVASDHSPCPPELREGPHPWAGISGVELTIPVLLDAGLDPVTVARLTTAAAPRLRLAGKGAIAIGATPTSPSWIPTRRGRSIPPRCTTATARPARGPHAARSGDGHWVRGRNVFDRAAGTMRDPGGAQLLVPA